MNFQFNVNLSDSDYLNYNEFWLLRSPYGKKQVISFRLTVAALFVAIFFVLLSAGLFSRDSFIVIISLFIGGLLVQLLLTKILSRSLKLQIKSLKKSGKMSYSPSSVVAFSEDSVSETAPDKKNEDKYSAIERISIVDNKVIYIHVNNLMAYILPLSCFESKEQYNDFLDFIKTKCANIDIY